MPTWLAVVLILLALDLIGLVWFIWLAYGAPQVGHAEQPQEPLPPHRSRKHVIPGLFA
jgi:hypothetical protein